MKYILHLNYKAYTLLLTVVISTILCYPTAYATDVKDEKEIASLVELAKNKEYSESSNALKALGKIGGPEAAEAIINALPRLHPTAQDDFCLILGAIGDNRAIEPLSKLLASRDSENAKKGGEYIFKVRARKAAAEALGKFRDPRARVALNAAIKNDPDWDVYHAAKQALYRMDSQTAFPGYEKLAAMVVLAVTKKPEPENGAEEFILNWHKENPNWQGAWIGPRLEDYASKVDIERARNSVVNRGGDVIELLMEYLCNRKLYIGPENAKALLIRIGKPAIPSLENGVKRGDKILAKNCRECIEAINAAESKH